MNKYKNTPSPVVPRYSPSPRHSSISYTPTKQMIKKFQSQLKTSVNNYGKLMVTWMDTVEQMLILLNYCMGLLVKKDSITKTLGDDTDTLYILKIFCNDRQYIFNQLCISIHKEIEHSLIQIASYQRRLRDIICAMILAYDEMHSMIANEGVDIFPTDDDEGGGGSSSSSVFNVDHFFTIQSLHKSYLLEVERKISLTSYIFGNSSLSSSSSSSLSSSSSSSSSNDKGDEYEYFDYDHRDHQYDINRFGIIISSLPDKAIDSFINMEQGHLIYSSYVMSCPIVSSSSHRYL